MVVDRRRKAVGLHCEDLAAVVIVIDDQLFVPPQLLGLGRFLDVVDHLKPPLVEKKRPPWASLPRGALAY
jgi:hypothetical protein